MQLRLGMPWAWHGMGAPLARCTAAQRAPTAPDPPAPRASHRRPAGSAEQIEVLQHGLQRLDHYLANVTNEQRYLYARTARHLRTAESTLQRTFWYYTAIYGTICLASFSQLVGVRMMFKKVRASRRWSRGSICRAGFFGLGEGFVCSHLLASLLLRCRVGSRGSSYESSVLALPCNTFS